MHLLGGYALTFIAIIQGLVLLPIYFKYIDITEYGYWVTILSVLTLLSIVNFGVSPVVSQRMATAYAKKKFQEYSDYFFSSLLIVSIISAVFILLCLTLYLSFTYLMTNVKAETNTLDTCFWIAALSFVFSFYNDILRLFSNSMLKPTFHLGTTILFKVLGIILVLFLLYNNYGIISIPIFLFTSELAILIVLTVNIIIKLQTMPVNISLRKRTLLDLLHVSPIMFGSIIGDRMASSAAPLLLTSFLTAELTTLYVITNKIAETLLQLFRVFISSVSAPLSHFIQEKPTEVFHVITTILLVNFFIGLITFSSYIIFNSSFISLWMSNDIALEQTTILLIGISTFIYALGTLMRQILFSYGEFRNTSIVSLFGNTVTVIISLFLINTFGIYGILFGSILGNSYMLLMFFKHIQNKLTLVINLKYFRKPLLTLILFGTSIFVIQNMRLLHYSWITLSTSILCYVIFGFCIIYLTNRNLLSQIKRIIQPKAILK